MTTYVPPTNNSADTVTLCKTIKADCPNQVTKKALESAGCKAPAKATRCSGTGDFGQCTNKAGHVIGDAAYCLGCGRRFVAAMVKTGSSGPLKIRCCVPGEGNKRHCGGEKAGPPKGLNGSSIEGADAANKATNVLKGKLNGVDITFGACSVSGHVARAIKYAESLGVTEITDGSGQPAVMDVKALTEMVNKLKIENAKLKKDLLATRTECEELRAQTEYQEESDDDMTYDDDN
jgi:hypothetical protein